MHICRRFPSGWKLQDDAQHRYQHQKQEEEEEEYAFEERKRTPQEYVIDVDHVCDVTC